MSSTTPQDTKVSLELLQIIFDTQLAQQQPAAATVAAADRASPSSRLRLRRMLKLLVDRSLVLGPIDAPSLHDIVLECGHHPHQPVAATSVAAWGGTEEWDRAV